MKPETLAAQALHAIDPQTGAIVPPIHLATTFARDAEYAPLGPIYARDESPVGPFPAEIQGRQPAMKTFRTLFPATNGEGTRVGLQIEVLVGVAQRGKARIQLQRFLR